MRTFVISALMLFLCSCSAVRELISQGVKEPQVQFEEAKIIGLSFRAIDLLFELKVKNSNKVGLKLSGLQYELLINDNPFLKGKQPKEIQIPSAGEEFIEIPMKILFDDLYSTFKDLGSKGLSSYEMKVKLSFEVPVIGAIEIPLSRKGELPMVKLPKISFEGLSINSLDLSKANIILNFKLSNPNSFDIVVNRGICQLKINDKDIFSGIIAEGIKVKEGEQSEIKVPINISFANVGMFIYQVLIGSDVANYAISGNLDLATSLPMLERAEIPFNLSGRTTLIH